MKRRAPNGSMHESWCAIFTSRRSCDCHNDDRDPRRHRPSPLSGDGVPLRKPELENAELCLAVKQTS
jgi:hypothetical protein